MQVLIARQNAQIIEKFYMPKSYSIGGKNTTVFNIGEKAFINLRDKVKAAGYNPYALMHW